MAYYIRILSPSEEIPSLKQLTESLQNNKLAGLLTAEDGTDDNWRQILLSHTDGTAIASIERNAASSTELVADEIDEFVEEFADCRPATAAEWLAKYLLKIRTIIAFQVLNGTDRKNGWDILGNVKNSIRSQVGGIIQADNEGFSNEEGFHILWQFSDSVSGKGWMGILKDGEWVHFQMDLGNPQHREAFFRGEVPHGATLRQ